VALPEREYPVPYHQPLKMVTIFHSPGDQIRVGTLRLERHRSGSWGRTNVDGFRGRCPAIKRSRNGSCVGEKGVEPLPARFWDAPLCQLDALALTQPQGPVSRHRRGYCHTETMGSCSSS
jgi:hypothetical protein